MREVCATPGSIDTRSRSCGDDGVDGDGAAVTVGPRVVVLLRAGRTGIVRRASASSPVRIVPARRPHDAVVGRL